jgi:hypothetical protein
MGRIQKGRCRPLFWKHPTEIDEARNVDFAVLGENDSIIQGENR